MKFGIAVSRMRKGSAFGAAILLLIALGGLTAFAAIPLSTTTAATQNFDSIGTAATATAVVVCGIAGSAQGRIFRTERASVGVWRFRRICQRYGGL